MAIILNGLQPIIRRKRVPLDPPSSGDAPVVVSTQPQAKRKRGRPPKQRTHYTPPAAYHA